ncbi:MAG: outer membrane lipoprotein-sorting protein [Nitrospinaceae bacterium]
MNAGFLSLILAGFLISDIPANLSPEEKGFAIMKESEKDFNEIITSQADMTMIIKKKDGTKATRNFRLLIYVIPEDGDKIRYVFDSPADVKGMVFLVVTHKFEQDDIWVYLPDSRRVKRVSSQTKGSRFMGSEFVSEDLAREEPEKYTYGAVREENFRGQKCFVVERFPVEKSSVYSKQVAWVDQDQYRVQKFDFYDKKGVFVKTLTFNGYRLYENKVWRWDEHVLVNHVKGDSTRTLFQNWKFNTGFKLRDFSINSLKRTR